MRDVRARADTMNGDKNSEARDRSDAGVGFYSFGISMPREICRGCGSEGKPAGFRNFCSACGKYPAEILAEQTNRDDGAPA